MTPSLSSVPLAAPAATHPAEPAPGATRSGGIGLLQWLACAAWLRAGVAAAVIGLLWALAAWAMHGGQ